jgi:hypothetical protein
MVGLVVLAAQTPPCARVRRVLVLLLGRLFPLMVVVVARHELLLVVTAVLVVGVAPIVSLVVQPP